MSGACTTVCSSSPVADRDRRSSRRARRGGRDGAGVLTARRPGRVDLSELELLGIQVEALFTHDRDGRIHHVNEPDGDAAPRFFFGRTRVGNLWRLRHDVAPETARRLEDLAVGERVDDDLRADPLELHAILAALREDAEVRSVESGPAYRFPSAHAAPVGVTRLTRRDLHLLRRFVSDLGAVARHFAARDPHIAVVEDGAAVSICYSARLTERAAEAGVETLDGYRGRGYAARVVAAWAHAVRATGRIPLYSTSWDNVASQAVARKLGLIQYAADLSVE